MRTGTETLVNAAVMLMCVATTYAVVDRVVIPKLTGPAPVTYKPGERVGDSLGDLSLGLSDTTVVVYASRSCGYCNDSAGFYRRLLSMKSVSGTSDFRVVVLGALGAPDAKAFVEAHHLSVDAILAIPPTARHRFTGTPAVLIVDRAGVVVGSWRGQASAGAEAEILSAIKRRTTGQLTP